MRARPSKQAAPAAAGGAPAVPVGAAVLAWVGEQVAGQGVHRPTAKRLALLTAELLETSTVQRGDLFAA